MPETLADRLRAARKAAGYTQLAVAERLGIAPPRVAEWESGKHEPGPERLRALAVMYGVGPDELQPQPADVEHDPRVWHGEMRATLRTLNGMRTTLAGLLEMTGAAAESVRGLVDSGVLLAGGLREPEFVNTLVPPVSPEERRAADERAQAILDRKRREAQTHEPPAPPKSAGGRKRGA